MLLTETAEWKCVEDLILARCCATNARPPSLRRLSSLCDLGASPRRAKEDSKKNVDNLELPVAFGLILAWQ